MPEKTLKNKSIEEIKKKVEDGVKKTGFPLEMEIGRILRNKDWYTNHSHFFLDITSDFTYRELDIKASKIFNNFDVDLFIECKHSESKQWVFFLPTEYIFLNLADLKYMPHKHDFFYYIPKSIDKSIFSILKYFCNFKNIALNSAIFVGDNHHGDEKTIKEAINRTIGALLFRILNYRLAPPKPLLKKRNINFACVIFDGPMFSCKTPEVKLDKIEYIKYKHILQLNLLKIPTSDRQLIEFFSYVDRTFSNSYIIEFIHKDFFPNYIDKLTVALKKLDAKPIQSLVKEWI